MRKQEGFSCYPFYWWGRRLKMSHVWRCICVSLGSVWTSVRQAPGQHCELCVVSLVAVLCRHNYTLVLYHLSTGRASPSRWFSWIRAAIKIPAPPRPLQVVLGKNSASVLICKAGVWRTLPSPVFWNTGRAAHSELFREKYRIQRGSYLPWY